MIKAEIFSWTSFSTFRSETAGCAPPHWLRLATIFAICTMRAWGVKMASVLIEKLRWHIPFCARNKAETFTNQHIRKVGTNSCWIINFPPWLFFSPTNQLWLFFWSMPCVYASVRNYFCPCVLLIVDGTVRVSCLSSSCWSANTAEAESVRQMDWKSNNQATKCPWHLQLVDTRALIAVLTDCWPTLQCCLFIFNYCMSIGRPMESKVGTYPFVVC